MVNAKIIHPFYEQANIKFNFLKFWPFLLAYSVFKRNSIWRIRKIVQIILILTISILMKDLHILHLKGMTFLKTTFLRGLHPEYLSSIEFHQLTKVLLMRWRENRNTTSLVTPKANRDPIRQIISLTMMIPTIRTLMWRTIL